jgi:hypothetical protein
MSEMETLHDEPNEEMGWCSPSTMSVEDQSPVKIYRQKWLVTWGGEDRWRKLRFSRSRKLDQAKRARRKQSCSWLMIAVVAFMVLGIVAGM